jgi:hypothetical protein
MCYDKIDAGIILDTAKFSVNQMTAGGKTGDNIEFLQDFTTGE